MKENKKPLSITIYQNGKTFRFENVTNLLDLGDDKIIFDYISKSRPGVICTAKFRNVSYSFDKDLVVSLNIKS